MTPLHRLVRWFKPEEANRCTDSLLKLVDACPGYSTVRTEPLSSIDFSRSFDQLVTHTRCSAAHFWGCS